MSWMEYSIAVPGHREEDQLQALHFRLEFRCLQRDLPPGLVKWEEPRPARSVTISDYCLQAVLVRLLVEWLKAEYRRLLSRLRQVSQPERQQG